MTSRCLFFEKRFLSHKQYGGVRVSLHVCVCVGFVMIMNYDKYWDTKLNKHRFASVKPLDTFLL